MLQTYRILRTRLKILNNHASAIRSHLWVHLAVFFLVVLFMFVGGTAFFYFLFHNVDKIEDFGSLLMDRLVGMVMMTFFSMLIFSNLVITLSTTYISREIEYHMSQPIEHRSIFFVKLFESTFYSSWGFAILAIPFFLSFGMVRETSIAFYGAVTLLLVPFLLIPASIGALLTMVLSAFLPARRTLKWTILLVLFAVVVSLVVVRITGAGSGMFRRGNDAQSFTQVLEILQAGQTLWSPHTWITRGILDVSRGDWRGFAYWLAMLWSAALMLLQICLWLSPPLYYRGWCLARETSSRRAEGVTFGQRVFGFIERRLGFVNRVSRALALKDMKTFWRDPAQWSQLVILFGILFVYTANLKSAYFQKHHGYVALEVWTAVLSLFNMSATCFILSILTTRFVYPMLSLEGKQFWVIGLAPIARTRIVWEKYLLCWLTSFALAESLMIFSNWMLEVSATMRLISTSTVFFISFGLTSISVGLGAAMPNFREDNPARIANGLGGTLNIILSLLYIGLFMGLEITPIYIRGIGFLRDSALGALVLPCCLGLLVLLELAAVVIPMRFGLRRWRAMEF